MAGPAYLPLLPRSRSLGVMMTGACPSITEAKVLHGQACYGKFPGDNRGRSNSRTISPPRGLISASLAT
jgi:hypothetical protein